MEFFTGIYIYGCVFLSRVQILVKARCSYPRIMPVNHTPKNHDYEHFFWDVWGFIGLTSFNGPDKLTDQCWPDPMIPGSGWLGGWLAAAGWLRGCIGGYGSCCCWLSGWLGLASCGWLLGGQVAG